eukprot:5806593-Prymnesium_polylepis.1
MRCAILQEQIPPDHGEDASHPVPLVRRVAKLEHSTPKTTARCARTRLLERSGRDGLAQVENAIGDRRLRDVELVQIRRRRLLGRLDAA